MDFIQQLFNTNIIVLEILNVIIDTSEIKYHSKQF